MTEDTIYDIISNYFEKLNIRFRNPRIGNRRYTVEFGTALSLLTIQLHGPDEKLMIFRSQAHEGGWVHRGPWEADVEKLAEHYKRRNYEYDMAAIRAKNAEEAAAAAQADRRLDKFRAMFSGGK